jgi:competence protein ComEA
MEFEILGRQIYIRKGVAIAAVILIALVLGGIGYIIKNKGGEVIGSNETSQGEYTNHQAATTVDKPESQEKLSSGTVKEAEQIKVYVVGCVKNSGVVTLEKGQIIEDAINAAGGATKEADLENINLAYELNENTMLKIYSKKETQTAQINSQGQSGNGNGKISDKSLAGVKIIKDSGGAVVNNNTETAATEKSGKININTASAAELDKLPGVGEKTASDIIAYREKSGGFKKIEDFMNVPRIGESRFNQVKEQITVK